jgi:serine/threonine protein kinase
VTHVITLLTTFQIVMECCEGGALNDIMKAVRSPLTEAQAKEVIAYSLLALKHCHSYDIIHRVSYSTSLQ